MTVKKDRVSLAAEAVERVVEFDHQGTHRAKLAAVGARMAGGEAETDTESGGSSTEEGESPRSVTMWRRRKAAAATATATAGALHSQVLKVMEEDLHLGDDAVGFSGREYDSGKSANGKNDCVSYPFHQILILSRPGLPCSPLSGKGGSAVKTTH
ncbi:uncharacterized protein LOC116194205 [Punica granatum]|uniref:VAN3-binding protein-like auxin canalisation domain-containing protein n=2 Tax=Punica granatum TaxID=22663 RepID=A0A218WCE3_PUNGR|nr:uncharacterized protein LOC116194205 [Punica granatum]XP_031378818.1 uncharacterized protein LOC116194205 [Punica granatum]OWM69752.1 hypothetical protein CDL15_Pgr025601 [Punica granatum]PKI33265.1 hypothetical protein CRG98_046339 [Punica granatum]